MAQRQKKGGSMVGISFLDILSCTIGGLVVINILIVVTGQNRLKGVEEKRKYCYLRILYQDQEYKNTKTRIPLNKNIEIEKLIREDKQEKWQSVTKKVVISSYLEKPLVPSGKKEEYHIQKLVLIPELEKEVSQIRFKGFEFNRKNKKSPLTYYIESKTGAAEKYKPLHQKADPWIEIRLK